MLESNPISAPAPWESPPPLGVAPLSTWINRSNAAVEIGIHLTINVSRHKGAVQVTDRMPPASLDGERGGCDALHRAMLRSDSQPRCSLSCAPKITLLSIMQLPCLVRD